MSPTTFAFWLRSRVDVSKVRLASQFGVTPGLVSHWLSGRRSPNRQTLLLASYIQRYGPLTDDCDNADCTLE